MNQDESLNILLVGAGGREFSLARKIIASPLCRRLFVAPLRDGFLTLNPAHQAQDRAQGKAEDKVQDATPADLSSATLIAFAKAQKIDLVVVGPEQPLVEGLADHLRADNILVFGPDAQGAALEGSKIAMKQAADAAGIPTAAWQAVRSLAEAYAFVEQQGAPLVIKTDGLAAGKGVVVAETEVQAKAAIKDAMEAKRFGAAGAQLVLEECLYGAELSYFALLDGAGGVVPLGSARDWKRAGVGDTGGNTGGMGSLSPAPDCTAAEEAEILDRFIYPMDRYLRQKATGTGGGYRGVLFAGLMRTAKGLRLLEYNVRFGDPETQSLLPRLKSDLVPLLLATARGDLRGDLRGLPATALPVWEPSLCLTLVLAAEGYPQAYSTGSVIGGLEALTAGRKGAGDGVWLVHAGTKYESSTGNWLADGGRVLALSAVAEDLPTAQAKLRKAVEQVTWPTGFYRSDLIADDTQS